MTSERFLSEEEVAWRDLCGVFDRVPTDRFEEPTLTPEGWSAKDAMFHIAGWMADCGVQLERIRAGTFDPAEETRDAIERQNRTWFEESRAMSPGDVRTGFAAARQRMREAFGTLDELSPNAIEWFEESGALHYAAHAIDLREWLGDSTA